MRVQESCTKRLEENQKKASPHHSSPIRHINVEEASAGKGLKTVEHILNVLLFILDHQTLRLSKQ